MADFAQDLQYFRASSSFPFLDIDPNIEQINNNLSVLDNTSLLNYQSFMPFSNPDNFFEFPGNLAENFPGNFLQNNMLPVCHTVTSTECESKNRKAVEISESSNEDSSPVSQIETNKRKKNSGRRKRVKGNEKEEEKSKEVVHVRARRGQATDSHSLAERVRRGKINERLRCLQDIVPGCFKTMGMTMMLDEIINYVQSLQNQVEFLSMKLTAASTFYDFNSESDAVETMQKAKAYEAKEMERLMKEGNFACSSSSSFLTITRPL